MEADQRDRSESNVVRATAGGSVDLRSAFGTVFNKDVICRADGSMQACSMQGIAV